ncbi:MAG: hypothetical protein IJY62_01345 [Clostridia bacterium]|nr:hypothetical protein [Clostridia bacterium]
MGKRKQPYRPKPFESDGNPSDTSANIYHSMLTSPQYKALSKSAKVLYTYCKAQYYAEKKKPVPKHESLTESESQRCFTMNMGKWRDEYEIYTNRAQFYKDMGALMEMGFIDLVEDGKTTRTKSVYMFSDRWKRDGYKPP